MLSVKTKGFEEKRNGEENEGGRRGECKKYPRGIQEL